MRIEQLYYVIKIAETGSFSVASQSLYISQPSISQSIASLETELGVQIFKRTRSGVEPTAFGQELIGHARSVVHEVEQIKASVDAVSQQMSTQITISVAPILSQTFLPAVIINFNKKFPQTRVTIFEGPTDQAQELQNKGQVDFCVVPYAVPYTIPKGFDFIPLFETRFLAIVGKDSCHARKTHITYKELQTCPLAYFTNSYMARNPIVSRISEYGKPNIVLKSQSPDFLKLFSANTDTVGFSLDLSLLDAHLVTTGDIMALNIEDPVMLVFGILIKENKHIAPFTEGLINDLVLFAEIKKQAINAFHERTRGQQNL